MIAETRRTSTVILISGRGSNMQAIVRAAERAGHPVEIAGVISNDPEAAGLAWARDRGLDTAAVDHRRLKGDRAAFDAALDAEIRHRGAELVVLAGFMRLLTAPFVEAWAGRMINIHPSLLPAFKGLDTHARTIAAGVRVAGCTAHFVVPEMDAGPIIAQAAVPVLPHDTTETLAARILRQEHVIYPAAVAAVASGDARLEGDTVRWAETDAQSGSWRESDALIVPHTRLLGGVC